MDSFGRVLVTGGTGFLGSRLVQNLLERGVTDIRCLVRSGSDQKELMRQQVDFPGARLELCRGDLVCEEDVRRAVQDVSLIFHCAAAKNGPLSQSFLNTVVATRNLIVAAQACTSLQRFVHVSSFAVYGIENLPRGEVIDEYTPVEKDHIRRNDGYSYVKCKQEELVLASRDQDGLPVVIVRPGVVYGPGGDEISRRVGVKLPGLYLSIGNRNFMPVTYVDNCAEAIVLAATVSDAEGQIFNILDDDLCTCSEFLRGYRRQVQKMRTLKIPYSVFWGLSWIYDRYCEYSKGQLPAVFSPCKSANTWKAHRFDNQKIRDVLGWRQGVPTSEGLTRHYQYFEEKLSQQ